MKHILLAFALLISPLHADLRLEQLEAKQVTLLGVSNQSGAEGAWLDCKGIYYPNRVSPFDSENENAIFEPLPAKIRIASLANWPNRYRFKPLRMVGKLEFDAVENAYSLIDYSWEHMTDVEAQLVAQLGKNMDLVREYDLDEISYVEIQLGRDQLLATDGGLPVLVKPKTLKIHSSLARDILHDLKKEKRGIIPQRLDTSLPVGSPYFCWVEVKSADGASLDAFPVRNVDELKGTSLMHIALAAEPSLLVEYKKIQITSSATENNER